MCLSYQTNSGDNFTKIEQYLRNKSQNRTKMGHFMDAESIQETLKNFNFTTSYALLMKRTTDICLNKVFHFKKSLGVILRV